MAPPVCCFDKVLPATILEHREFLLTPSSQVPKDVLLPSLWSIIIFCIKHCVWEPPFLRLVSKPSEN